MSGTPLEQLFGGGATAQQPQMPQMPSMLPLGPQGMRAMGLHYGRTPETIARGQREAGQYSEKDYASSLEQRMKQPGGPWSLSAEATVLPSEGTELSRNLASYVATRNAVVARLNAMWDQVQSGKMSVDDYNRAKTSQMNHLKLLDATGDMIAERLRQQVGEDIMHLRGKYEI